MFFLLVLLLFEKEQKVQEDMNLHWPLKPVAKTLIPSVKSILLSVN